MEKNEYLVSAIGQAKKIFFLINDQKNLSHTMKKRIYNIRE